MSGDISRKTKKLNVRQSFAALAVLVWILVTSPNPAQAQWATSGSNIYNTNSGDVGIGTTTASYLLDVDGNARIQGTTLYTGSSSSTYGSIT